MYKRIYLYIYLAKPAKMAAAAEIKDAQVAQVNRGLGNIYVDIYLCVYLSI